MVNDDIGHFKVVLEAEVSKDIGESLEKGFKDSSEKVGKNLKSEIEKSIDKSIKKAREFERAFKVPSFGEIGEKLTKVVGSGLKSAIASSIAYISSKPIKAKIEADISTIGPYNDPKSGGLAPPEDRSSGLLAMAGKIGALVSIAVFIYDILKGLAPLVGLIKMIGAILQITLYPIANFFLVVFKPILGIILKYLVLPFYYWIEKFNAWWTQIFGNDANKTEADKAVETTAIVAGGAIGAAIGSPAGPFGMLIGAMLGAFTGYMLANFGRLIGEWLDKKIPDLTWDDILPSWDWENSPLNKWLTENFSGITWDSLLPKWDWENSPLNKWLTENFSDLTWDDILPSWDWENSPLNKWLDETFSGLTWDNIIAKFDWVDSLATYWEKLKWSDFISAFDWVSSLSTYWEKLKWSDFISAFDWASSISAYWEKLKWSAYITVFDWVSSISSYWEKLKWSDFIPQFTWPEFKWPTITDIKKWMGLYTYPSGKAGATEAAIDYFEGIIDKDTAIGIFTDYFSGVETAGESIWQKIYRWIEDINPFRQPGTTPTTTSTSPIGPYNNPTTGGLTPTTNVGTPPGLTSIGSGLYTFMAGRAQYTAYQEGNLWKAYRTGYAGDVPMTWSGNRWNYAEGGVATRATRINGIFGEAGAEALLPVNSLKSMIRDEMRPILRTTENKTIAPTVNINIERIEKDVDIDNLIEKIERALYINIKRGGIR